MTARTDWDDHLDALDAWATGVLDCARTGAPAPAAPTGGPDGVVPPRLRLRALALVARLDDAERSLVTTRRVLEREHVYSG